MSNLFFDKDGQFKGQMIGFPKKTDPDDNFRSLISFIALLLIVVGGIKLAQYLIK